MNIVITKKYNFFTTDYIFKYKTGISVMRISTFPRRRERRYKVYFNESEQYKVIYADSEGDAIIQAIKIIKKKLFEQASRLLDVCRMDWVVTDGKNATFYGSEFKNRKSK